MKQLQSISTGQLVCLRVPDAAQLRIVKGQAWLTIEGVIEDYVLHAGAVIELIPGRTVLVEGVSDCIFETQVVPQESALAGPIVPMVQAVVRRFGKLLQPSRSSRGMTQAR